MKINKILILFYFSGFPFETLKTFKSGFTITKVKCKIGTQCDDKRMLGLTFIFTRRRNLLNAYCICKVSGNKFVIANDSEIPWNIRQCGWMRNLGFPVTMKINAFSGVVFIEEEQLIVGFADGFIYSALLPEFDGYLKWQKHETKLEFKYVNGAFYDGIDAYFISKNHLYRVVYDDIKNITWKKVKVKFKFNFLTQFQTFQCTIDVWKFFHCDEPLISTTSKMTTVTSKQMVTTNTSEHMITMNDKMTTNVTSLPFIIIGFVALIIFGTIFWLMAARLKRKWKRIPEKRVIRHRNKDSDEIPNKSSKKITKKSSKSEPKWGDLDPTLYMRLQIARIPSTDSLSSSSTSSSTSETSLNLDNENKKEFFCNEKSNESWENDLNLFKSTKTMCGTKTFG